VKLDDVTGAGGLPEITPVPSPLLVTVIQNGWSLQGNEKLTGVCAPLVVMGRAFVPVGWPLVLKVANVAVVAEVMVAAGAAVAFNVINSTVDVSPLFAVSWQ
jgi:hypothetical protein